MLSREHRLRDRRAIQLVHRRGTASRTPNLTLKVFKRQVNEPARLAVIVSTKVAKQATLRNRLRRRLLGAAKPLQDQLAPGADILVVVNHSELEKLPAGQLQQELISGLGKLGALANNR